jgi:hypothetical protein
VGSSSVVNEYYQPPSEPRGSSSGADAVWGSAEGQAEDHSIEQGITSKDSTDIEDPTLEDSTDFSEVEWPVDDQIKDMEARLEVLRTIKEQEEKVKAKAKAAPGRD